MSKSECEALMDETSAYCAALQKSGHLIVAEPLEPVQMAMTVRVRNGKVSATDGPFAETKEQIGGFFLINARSLNEARQVASRISPVRLGSAEGRPGVALLPPRGGSPYPIFPPSDVNCDRQR